MQVALALMTSGFLRVYFLDDAWVTIPAQFNTPTEEIRQTILKKRNLQSDPDAATYNLYMTDCSRSIEGYDKCLDPAEFPLEIQETLRKHGKLDSFKFVFKADATEDKAGTLSGNSSDSADEIFSSIKEKLSGAPVKEGYLEKRGKRNKAWRERWFVLQGGSLYYFKNHTKTNAISNIPLADASYRQCEGTIKGRVYLFEVITSTRIFQLKASSQEVLVSWMTALKQFSPCQEETLMDDIAVWIEAIEFEKSTQQERVVEACSTLGGCLQSELARDYYMEFLLANHMEENLMFWLETENYRKENRSLKELEKKGLEIYEKFLRPGGSHEIGYIDVLNREKFPKVLYQGSIEERKIVFQELTNRCFVHMEMQGWPQFKTSQPYKHCILDLANQASRGAADEVHFEDFDSNPGGADGCGDDGDGFDVDSNHPRLAAFKKKLFGGGGHTDTKSIEEQPNEPTSTPTSMVTDTPTSIVNPGWKPKPKTIFDFDDDDDDAGPLLTKNVKQSNNSKPPPTKTLTVTVVAPPTSISTPTFLKEAPLTPAKTVNGGLNKPAAPATHGKVGGSMYDISDDDDIDDLLAEYS